MIPAEQWWSVLIHYNHSIFPMQIVFYVLSLLVTLFFIFKSNQTTEKLFQVVLSVQFLWIALVFFFLKGKALPAYQAQTFLFTCLGLCFLINLFTGNVHFRFPKNGLKRILVGAAFLISFCYPLVSLLLGRPLEQWIIPGSFPCPTTAAALVFYSTATPPKKRWLSGLTVGLLLLWAIPFPLLIQIPKFGVVEDGIMLFAGIFLILSLIFRKHPQRKPTTRLSHTIQTEK